MRPRTQPAKALCASRGIKNIDLARSVGVSPHYIGRVLNGTVWPSEQLRQRISAALGVPAEDLFDNTAGESAVDDLLRRTRAERGIALVIDDPAVIAKVAAIVARDGGGADRGVA